MLKIPSYKERPVINSYHSLAGMEEPRSFDLRTLIYWVKRTPECIGILKRIATDIVTEIEFHSVTNQKTGRPIKNFDQKVEGKATEFWRANSGRQKMIAAVLDWLLTGDFYFWKGRLSENQLKEIVLKHYAEYGIEVKEVKLFNDEDFNRVNSIETVPSSTMFIEHNETEIVYFKQKPKNMTQERIFRPEEIIHGKFLEIDGNVYGYSPMEASYVSIRTINAIQDYGYYYFQNGAKIDRVWKFMGNPNDTYVEAFKENLRQYKAITRSHADLVISGADKIESESLNEIKEEMQYRQLAIHSVGRLAFAFNMPADILSSILGVDVKGTAMGSDIEDAGYNRNIIQAQIYIEELMNSQLFIPEFGVEMVFERTFRQDQIRQIQYLAMAMPVAEFMFKHEVPVNDEYYFDLFQIPRKYRMNGKIKKEIEMALPYTPPNKPIQGEGEKKVSDAKRLQQKPQENIQPQTGA